VLMRITPGFIPGLFGMHVRAIAKCGRGRGVRVTSWLW